MLRRICFTTVLMCFAILSLAACGAPATPPTSAPAAATLAPQPAAPTQAPPAATPTVEPSAQPTQPAALSGTTIDMNNPIFKAYFAVYNKFPRRMHAEAFDSKTRQTTTMLVETDAKDHLHLEVGGMGSTNGVTVSMVIISPTLYLKQGAAWLKMTTAQGGTFLGMLTDADSLQQLLNAFGDLASYTVTPIGPEDVNGTPAIAYSSEFTLKDGKTTKGKAWVGPDGMIIKDLIETSDGMTITTTYEFDPNIKVEAPIP